MQKDASVSLSSQSSKLPPKQSTKPTSTLSIDSLDPSKPLASTTSCLEYLLISFCHHFSLKPKQAAGLLTQDGKYLIYVLSKGLKGRHEPVVEWYQALYGGYQPLLGAIVKEEASGSVPFVLGAVHGGLMARSLETVQWTCRVLTKLGKDLQDQGVLPAAWDWFVETGIEACLAACGRFGPDIKGQVVMVMVQFAHNNFLELFTIQLRNRLSSVSYLVTMVEFLPPLCEIRTGKQELLADGILDFWLDLSLKESQQSRPLDIRSAALSLLCEIWTRFPTKIDTQEELADNILTALKRATRNSKSDLMHLVTIVKMFGLLDRFSEERNAYAPIIYKTLTFALVENYNSTKIREFLLENFTKTFQSMPEMPIGILLDPYLKQMQLSDELMCNLMDLRFFWEVGKHPRLGLKNAIQVLDVLAKCITAVPIYLNAIQPTFRMIIERFLSTPAMQDFLYQFVKQLLLLCIQGEAQWSSDEIELRIRYGFVEAVVEMVKKSEAKGRFMKVLIAANNEYRKLTGQPSERVIRILELFGDVKKIAGLETDPDVYKIFPKLAEEQPSPPKKPPLKPKERVKADIDQAKIKREQLIAKTQMQKQMEEQNTDRKQRTFKRQFELKRITMDQGFVRPNSLEPQRNVFFFDLSEEPTDDQDGVHAIMRKYLRVLKLLYQKYSSSGYRQKDNTTFEKQIQRLSLITEPEMFKMLKDQGVAPKFITKDAMSGIFKMYCTGNQRMDQMSVDYDGYYEILIQVAAYVFSKPPKDLSAYPIFVSVKSFFDLLRTASADHGLPLKFFDEPDPGAGDRDLCRKLTQSLQQNPNTELPDGYKKVTDYELHVSYAIPRAVKIPRSWKMALGVLDDILSSELGVHILEPQFKFKPVLRAQGVLLKQATKLAMPVSIDPEIKYKATLLTKEYPSELVSECAVLLEDLIYSVEMLSPVLLTRGKPGKALQNQVQRMKEMKEREEQIQKEKAERRRQLRRQMVQETLKTALEVKKKMKKRERRKQRKAEKMQVEELQKRGEEKIREKEARMQQIREWHQQKMQLEQSQLVEESLKKQREVEEKAKLRKEFLSKERQRLASMFKKQNEKAKQDQEQELIALQKQEETKQTEKETRIKAVLQHRKQRDFGLSMKQRLQEAESHPEVLNVLAEFDKALEVVFVHYCRGAARLDMDALLAMKALPLPGFKKFCTQFEVVPNLLSSDQSTQIFGRLTKTEHELEGVLALSYDLFKSALIELALLGKPALAKIRQSEPPSDSFSPQDLRSFLDYMTITSNPKVTLTLLKKVSAPVSLQRGETKTQNGEATAKGAKK